MPEPTMITATELIQLTGAKPQTFRLEKNDTEGLENILNEWIIQSEGLITSYCNNQFTEEVPLAVKNVCLRLSSNMVAFAQARKDTPLIKVNDWTTQIISSGIFTEDLKDDLIPFMKERPSSKSDYVGVFCVSGDDFE